MPRFLDRLLARAGRRTASDRRPHPRWCRPKVEGLEERANPVTLNFVPFSVVGSNPSGLPPTALLQFNPLPDLGLLPPAGGTFQSPIQIHGTFQQSLVPAAAAATASATPVTPAGHLSVTYNLQGSVNGTVTPFGSTAAQPGALNATFTLTGKLTEVLYLPGAAPQPVWSISAAITEQGGVSGPLLPPQAGPAAVDIMTFNATIGLTQTEARVAVAASSGVAVTPWSVKATVQAAGKFQVGIGPSPLASPISRAVPFTVDDQIAASVSPIAVTAVPPSPPIKISAVDSASGMVTENTFPPPTAAVVVPFGSGTTQYHELLTETITYPPSPTNPGATQTVTEAFDTTGFFQNAVLPEAVSNMQVTGPVTSGLFDIGSDPTDLT